MVKKTAQRIILELKDKLKADDLTKDNQLNTGNIVEEDNYSYKIQEVLEALIALGYTEKEAEKAVSKINKADSIEVMIKESLKLLMN